MLHLNVTFKPKTRKWWNAVAEGDCQYESYTERRGWQQCRRPLEHVHHVVPEGRTLARGRNPEKNTAMPLCRPHHVRNTGSEEHSEGFSFHPDIGEAYRSYGDWKREKQHQESILKRPITRASMPSPFDDAAKEHGRLTRQGKRYHAGTPEKEHPRTDRSKRKKKWYDYYFDKK